MCLPLALDFPELFGQFGALATGQHALGVMQHTKVGYSFSSTFLFSLTSTLPRSLLFAFGSLSLPPPLSYFFHGSISRQQFTMSSSDFNNPLRKFKLVFLGEQSGECLHSSWWLRAA